MDVGDLFTDEKSENEGVWVDAADYDRSLQGLQLKIARLMNPGMSRMLDEEVRNAGPKYDDDEAVRTDITIRCYAKHVLKGWKGLTNGGKAVKYTEELAEEYLARSTDLRNVVTRISQDRTRFKIQQDETDRKN